MRERIIGLLKSIEAEHGVKVLYACESGSRAWGFASPDSDYDVRFVYVRPLEDYLSLASKRDVIEKSSPNGMSTSSDGTFGKRCRFLRRATLPSMNG